MYINKICCMGAGLIGHSWATLFSLSGCSVTLCDLTDEILEDALVKIGNNLNFLVSQGFIEKSRANSALTHISLTTNQQKAVNNVDYIQESVYENYEVKKAV